MSTNMLGKWSDFQHERSQKAWQCPQHLIFCCWSRFHANGPSQVYHVNVDDKSHLKQPGRLDMHMTHWAFLEFHGACKGVAWFQAFLHGKLRLVSGCWPPKTFLHMPKAVRWQIYQSQLHSFVGSFCWPKLFSWVNHRKHFFQLLKLKPFARKSNNPLFKNQTCHEMGLKVLHASHKVKAVAKYLAHS